MALPPSWKSEVQKTIEERINADAQDRHAQQLNAGAEITNALKAIGYAQQTQTSHTDTSDQRNRWINVVTLFFVFLTVIFTYKSWRTFEAQVEEMQKVYAPIKESADATKSQLLTTIDELHKSQRPWISASDAKIIGNYPDPAPNVFNFILEYDLKNTGRSLAKKGFALAYPVSGSAEKMTQVWNKACESPSQWLGEKPNQVWQTGMVIAPGQTVPIKGGLGIEGVKATDGFWIFGCVVYSDQFDIRHHTRFCFLKTGPSMTPKDAELSDCAQGEEAD